MSPDFGRILVLDLHYIFENWYEKQKTQRIQRPKNLTKNMDDALFLLSFSGCQLVLYKLVLSINNQVFLIITQ